VSAVGYLAAALGGVLLGWLLCAAFLRRPHPDDATDDGADAALAAAVLTASTTAYAVIDDDGNAVLANPAATELGVVRAGLPDPRIAEAAARAAVSDEPVDVEISPPGPVPAGRGRPSAVHAVARSLGDGLVVVAAADESAAQRVEAVRRDFVANVSHELKTPVSAIALLAEAVLDGADDPELVHAFARKLITESTRLGTLVNELIALSRLQGAEPLTDLSVVEIDAVVAEAVNRVASSAERAQIEVTTDEPSGLLVLGDRTLLVTALTNLLENAVNYSPDRSSVSVSRKARDAMVEVAVTDRGIGIAPEHQGRVFERFFRVDPARSRATGGTGLGLAIVKHVAANHGGHAGVWSRPGTGSTFTLAVPQLPASPSSGDPSSGALSYGTPSSAPASSGAAEASRKPVSVPDQAARDRGEP
jgi:two-component system sensor histidine kinase SenX3